MKYFLNLLWFYVLIGIQHTSYAQIATNFEVVVEGNDTVFIGELPTFNYIKEMTAQQKIEYLRLVSRVKYVLPYAKLAAFHLQQVEQKINAISSKKEKKKYIKKYSKELKESFSKQLKNLTIDEGKMLVKLVSRETGSTVYDILGEYSGSAEKFFYNSFSSLYGYDLSETYDEVENYKIEKIIKDFKLE